MEVSNDSAEVGQLDKILKIIRVLLPLMLGFLGWYVGQILAPLEKRISDLEKVEQSYTIFKDKVEEYRVRSSIEIMHNTEAIKALRESECFKCRGDMK